VDPTAPSNGERLVGENVRVVLNCTFRGVTASWLRRYLDEARARLRGGADLARALLERILTDRLAMPFRIVADQAPCALQLSSNHC
jgi:hypothetical protein